MFLGILISLPLVLASFVAYRIYRFLKWTEAPILQGERIFNIRYKKGKKLDIYQPTKQVFTKAPVVVFLHGGGWVMGTKYMANNGRFHPAFNHLREQGYAIISVAYTLARRNRPPFPACLEDAHAALAWLQKNADTYRLDVNDVGIMGESAGAHIAQMLTFTPRDTFGDDHGIDLKYLVDVYGPTDLYRLYTDLGPMLNHLDERRRNLPNFMQSYLDLTRKLFGFDPKDDPERARTFAQSYSPIHRVNADIPPVLMIHGTRDRVVPFSQSVLLQEALTNHQIEHDFHPLEDVGHSFRGANQHQWTQLQHWIVDFIQQNVNKDTSNSGSELALNK